MKRRAIGKNRNKIVLLINFDGYLVRSRQTSASTVSLWQFGKGNCIQFFPSFGFLNAEKNNTSINDHSLLLSLI